MLNVLKTDLEQAEAEGAEFFTVDSLSVEILKIFLLHPDWESKLNKKVDAEFQITSSIYILENGVPVIQVMEDLKNSGSSSIISSQEIRNKLVELDNKIELLEFQIADKMTTQQRRVDNVVIKYFNIRKWVKMIAGLPYDDEWTPDLSKVLADREASNILSMKLRISESVFNSRREPQQML